MPVGGEGVRVTTTLADGRRKLARRYRFLLPALRDVAVARGGCRCLVSRIVCQCVMRYVERGDVFFLDRDVSKEKCASYPEQGRKYAGGLDSGDVNRVTVSFKWAGKNNWMLYYLDAFYALGRKLVENDDAEPCVSNDFEVSAHRSFWRAALFAVVGDLFTSASAPSLSSWAIGRDAFYTSFDKEALQDMCKGMAANLFTHAQGIPNRVRKAMERELNGMAGWDNAWNGRAWRYVTYGHEHGADGYACFLAHSTGWDLINEYRFHANKARILLALAFFRSSPEKQSWTSKTLIRSLIGLLAAPDEEPAEDEVGEWPKYFEYLLKCYARVAPRDFPEFPDAKNDVDGAGPLSDHDSIDFLHYHLLSLTLRSFANEAPHLLFEVAAFADERMTRLRDDENSGGDVPSPFSLVPHFDLRVASVRFNATIVQRGLCPRLVCLELGRVCAAARAFLRVGLRAGRADEICGRLRKFLLSWAPPERRKVMQENYRVRISCHGYFWRLTGGSGAETDRLDEPFRLDELRVDPGFLRKFNRFLARRLSPIFPRLTHKGRVGTLVRFPPTPPKGKSRRKKEIDDDSAASDEEELDDAPLQTDKKGDKKWLGKLLAPPPRRKGRRHPWVVDGFECDGARLSLRWKSASTAPSAPFGIDKLAERGYERLPNVSEKTMEEWLKVMNLCLTRVV